MNSKANSQTTIPEQKQSGCCCDRSADATKGAAAEHSAKPDPVYREDAAKDFSDRRSEGCCGAH